MTEKLAPVVLPVVARLRELIVNLKDCIDQQVALTDASTHGGQSVGRSPRMQRSMALELQKRVAEVDAVLAACPGENSLRYFAGEVLRRFEESEATGAHTRDREYAIALLRKGLEGAALTLSEGTRTTKERIMREELCRWLDLQTITGETIGDIRRSCFLPWECAWNGIVRDETAKRERSVDPENEDVPVAPSGPRQTE